MNFSIATPSKLLPVLAFSLLAVTGCSSLLPGYEVLSMPQPIENMTPGSSWIDGVGAEGDPYGEVAVSDGLGSLTLATKDEAKFKITAHVRGILSSSLGYKSEEIVDIKLKDLKHHKLIGLRDTALRGKVLAEAITAKVIQFSVKESSTAKLTVKSVQSAVESSVAGKVVVKLVSGLDVYRDLKQTSGVRNSCCRSPLRATDLRGQDTELAECQVVWLSNSGDGIS